MRNKLLIFAVIFAFVGIAGTASLRLMNRPGGSAGRPTPAAPAPTQKTASSTGIAATIARPSIPAVDSTTRVAVKNEPTPVPVPKASTPLLQAPVSVQTPPAVDASRSAEASVTIAQLRDELLSLRQQLREQTKAQEQLQKDFAAATETKGKAELQLASIQKEKAEAERALDDAAKSHREFEANLKTVKNRTFTISP